MRPESPQHKLNKRISLSHQFLRGEISPDEYHQAKQPLMPDYAKTTQKIDWLPGVIRDLNQIPSRISQVFQRKSSR